MTSMQSTPTIILIPGYWLGAWAWEEVVEHLRAAGRRAIPLTLPGLDPADSAAASRTLDDQLAAIERAVADAGPEPVLVAHSGANGPVTLMLDRHPELIGRVIWVDSGPAAPGAAFAPDFPADAESLRLPEFEVLSEQASLTGLSAEMLERLRARAVAEPGGVVRQPVQLVNDARFGVPTTFVCSSLSSAQLHELADAGHPMFAEVNNYTDVDSVDLETGHWPMWSRPRELAGIIDAAASAHSPA